MKRATTDDEVVILNATAGGCRMPGVGTVRVGDDVTVAICDERNAIVLPLRFAVDFALDVCDECLDHTRSVDRAYLERLVQRVARLLGRLENLEREGATHVAAEPERRGLLQ